MAEAQNGAALVFNVVRGRYCNAAMTQLFAGGRKAVSCITPFNIAEQEKTGERRLARASLGTVTGDFGGIFKPVGKEKGRAPRDRASRARFRALPKFWPELP
jgi:hypothetical protein